MGEVIAIPQPDYIGQAEVFSELDAVFGELLSRNSA